MRRWLRFAEGGRIGCGSLDPDGVTIHLYSGEHIGAGEPTGAVRQLGEVVLLSPCEPSKFIGLWNNFGELAGKLGTPRPAEPLYFLKASNSFLAPGGTICRPPGYEGRIFYEGELGIVMKSTCSRVDEDEAMGHILGYTCVNDVTAFDLLEKDPTFAQWTRAKSCDTFGPFGPVVAEGLDWRSLRIRTLVNGRERQNYPASDMILTPGQIISHISQDMTLRAGDVIACGTSVGALPMKPDARIDVVIEGIGTLSNTLEAMGTVP